MDRDSDTPQVNYNDFSKIVDVSDPKGCLIGDYDYKALCMPRNPFSKQPQGKPKFYAVDEPIPLLTGLLMGFQHAVAMIGGIIVPAMIISGLTPDDSVRTYLVSASLIVSGIGSIIQCLRFRIPGTRLFFGTGILTVVGNGIQQVFIVKASIQNMMARGTSFEDAYGKCLGTLLVCALTVIAVSFLKPKGMSKIFPPWIAGLTVFVAGTDLINVGLGNWGGSIATCANTATEVCLGNGGVQLVYGSWPYIALGSTVFLVIIVIEFFGSPFLRNIQIMVGFLVGYAVAALASYDGKSFINSDKINAAPAFQFLWFKTFKLGFYPAAVLPLIIGFLCDASNTVGDITASEEASGLLTYGPEHDAHLQGGLLADGVNSMFAALGTTTPVLVYAQNNGVISFTMVASRVAGTFCGIWLIVFGMLGKFGAVLSFAPNVILGGLQAFVFGSVAVAGLRLMNMCKFNRRMRFIQVLAVALGLGITNSPGWAKNALWNPPSDAPAGVQTIRDSIIMIMGTGFAMSFVVAVVLHNILPEEEDPEALQSAARKNAEHYGATAEHGESPVEAVIKPTVV